jgi:hypothetical protein
MNCFKTLNVKYGSEMLLFPATEWCLAKNKRVD